jgi:phage terminase large subunit-like protein
LKVKRRQAEVVDLDSDIKHVDALELDEIYEALFGSRKLEDLNEAELAVLADADGLVEKRKREYGILYYKPYESIKIENGKRIKDSNGNNVLTGVKPQLMFHKSRKKVRLLLGGNQSGKTQGGAAEAIDLSLGLDLFGFGVKMPTPNKGRIYGENLDKGIMEVIWPKYESLMPIHELRKEPSKYSGGQVKKVQYKNFSTVEFMSYEMPVKASEGWTGNWVWFDEPPPKDIFVACYRGLMRYGGLIFITATPLSEAWIYDELYLNAGPKESQPDVFVLPTRGNPFLSDEEVEAYANTVPEDERPARLDGVFKHLSGLVYKEFGQIHRIPAFKVPLDWSRCMVMDFHQREPCAILWVAVDPQGILYAYDELKVDKNIPEIAEIIKMKEKAEYGRPVPTRWIDSIAATPDRMTGKSALKEFRVCGSKIDWPLAFRASVKNHSAGFKAVHEYLQIKNNKPGMYFMEENVPHTIGSMTHLQWDDFAGLKEKVKSGSYVHFADDVRYICVMKPQYRVNLPDDFEEFIPESEIVTGYRGH